MSLRSIQFGLFNISWFAHHLYSPKLHVNDLSSFVDWYFPLVLLIFRLGWTHVFLAFSIFIFSEATLLGRYFVTSWTVSPDHDWKYPFWISLIHFGLTGMNSYACRYLNKYVWFVMWYALLILCSGYLPICELLYSKGTLHNQVFFHRSS